MARSTSLKLRGRHVRPSKMPPWRKNLRKILRFTFFQVENIKIHRGTRKLTGEKLKFIWAEFSTLSMDRTGRNLGRVFNFRFGHLQAEHFRCYQVKLPNLKMKIRPKQLLGYLPLVIMLPALSSAVFVLRVTWWHCQAHPYCIMEQCALKNVNNYLYNIYSYSETSGGKSSNLFIYFIFSTPVLIRYLWQLKAVVFLHWCLILTVLLYLVWNRLRRERFSCVIVVTSQPVSIPVQANETCSLRCYAFCII